MREHRHFLEITEYLDRGIGVSGALRSKIKKILMEDLKQFTENPSEEKIVASFMCYNDEEALLLIYEYQTESCIIT